jgi:hypothetical protein
MNVQLKHQVNFTAGIWYNNLLQMNNYSAQIHMRTTTMEPTNHNTAFERLKYFVYYGLDSSIILDQQLTDPSAQFVSAGLKITTMPGDPVDQLVGIMLYYKLNAIMEERIVVTQVEINSNLGDNITYIHNEHEAHVGIIPPEWWTAPDLTQCTTKLVQQDKVVTMSRTQTWRELDLSWPDNNITEPGNVVVFADFKRNETE